MIALLKQTIANNLTIKIVSLIIGYCIWSFLGNIFIQTKSVKVPVCFYNVSSNKEIIAQPELVAIQIQGKKADLKACDDLALHINAEPLLPGEYKIVPCEEQLFLPKTVNLLHYKPYAVHVAVVEKNNNRI